MNIEKRREVKTGLERLENSLGELAKHTKSDSTKAAYASDWSKFREWCDTWQCEALPATPRTIALYVAWLDQEGRVVSTIQRNLTAINQAHAIAGFDRPVDARLREILKGLRRMRGIRPTKKKAITLDLLRRMVQLTPGGALGVRDRALLLVCWTAALRRSELVALNVDDLETRDKGLVLHVRKSKTDQNSEGRQIGIPFIDAEKRLCAPRALRTWLDLANIREGAIFRPVGASGRNKIIAETIGDRLSDRQVAYAVKAAAKRAGLDPKEFAGHSLRSGLATSLASVGVDDRRIQEITGHRSIAVLRGYIQSGAIFSDHPVLALFEGPVSQGAGKGG
jgi:site-specific recombinase XerD